ncbi:MAG: EAL domain-containing protein [Thiobacillus sp.]|uniref:EAL domain-containing protein n=1 Tax=Thiobacillus sp. TaxID=924 RepID=UPI002734CD24|nr:EAL domain-containing protein [Thiobacillus sp.]MDP3584057.1 EAL domain-containing protein [Thiobacillus sp.]
MSEQSPFALRSILLPAVLQVEDQAPCFGTIASLSEQGLSFDFRGEPLSQRSVGLTAQLDFDLQDKHHSCKGLIVNIQGGRALLSLRSMPSAIVAALQSAPRHGGSTLTARLSSLQVQQGCHASFMENMKAVVDDFYALLPEQIQLSVQPEEANDPAGMSQLQKDLVRLRPQFTRWFTQAYPMHPELRGSVPAASPANATDPIDMARVDDWIRRTTIAQKAVESLGTLLEAFDLHYSNLLNSGGKRASHPFQLDALLSVLADLLEPLKIAPDKQIVCYELMARAFTKHAVSLYQSLLDIVGDAPPELIHHPQQITSLEEWLKLFAAGAAPGAESENADANASSRINELSALLGRLTNTLGELNLHLPIPPSSETGGVVPSGMLVPAMLARDRIFGRFLPATTGLLDAGNLLLLDPARLAAGSGMSAVGKVLGGLTDLDNAALQGLHALMRQPPPIDPGPEKLGQASQVRALMLQAQGLLLEYTLNGLTYESQPDHPAWTLINALDALHQGADDRGQFLDPALHHGISLSMQWLLGQENVDAALEQIDRLLLKINTQLQEARQSRREQHLKTLGSLILDSSLIGTAWCVVKQGDVAIPYEVLGTHEDTLYLLNRSATVLLDIPVERFLQQLDSGQIEEAESFDEPFLERIADATLTASLNAVHAFTWQDPASGCLKRNALMDELERRLAHPVTEPPTFCALIEIPTMRPSLSSLPGDELAVMQKRTGEIILNALENGERCGRLSDVSFMLVFAPQDPEGLATRLSQLKIDMESLHAEWKMIGAVVPLLGEEASLAPSSVLRRANQACTPLRQHAGFDLSCLSNVPPVSNQIDPLPFSSLYLRCQKIASCDKSAPSHYEILLGVDEALVPSHTTQSFVVMAEQTDRIHALDTWVLKTVLEWMGSNAAGLDKLSGLSVNVSGNSLTLTHHVDAMISLLSDHPHLTSKLIIEVTETAAIDNMDVAVRSLRKLRALGCRIALDDFGSGYSSYSYVRSLPLDYLKIDGTYIRNILTDKTDQALTASMVDVAHALGLKVIAEYVDSEATYAWLKELGVDYVQGYWVHKPEPLNTLVLN